MGAWLMGPQAAMAAAKARRDPPEQDEEHQGHAHQDRCQHPDRLERGEQRRRCRSRGNGGSRGHRRLHRPRPGHLVDAELVARMGELGLMGVAVPSEWGGTGADTVSYVLAMEEVSRACASTGGGVRTPRRWRA